MTQRQGSKLSNLDLSAFDDPKPRRLPSREEIDRTAAFPSRDPLPEKEGDDQVNIRGRMSVIRRFKALAKDSNLSHVKMLERMMDEFEGNAGRSGHHT